LKWGFLDGDFSIRNFHIWCSDVSSLKIAIEAMDEYDTSQFRPRSLKCPEPRQQASPGRLRALQLARKKKGGTTIVDHFFEPPNLKSNKS
jgi:hypothetical protein